MQNVRTITRLEGGLSASHALVFGRYTKAYAAGAGAGTARTIAVTDVKELPGDYTVIVVAAEDSVHWISAKTAAGFTVNIAPRLAANTLAGGNADIIILA